MTTETITGRTVGSKPTPIQPVVRRVKIKVSIHAVDDELSNQEVRQLVRDYLRDMPYRVSLGHPYSHQR